MGNMSNVLFFPVISCLNYCMVAYCKFPEGICRFQGNKRKESDGENGLSKTTEYKR